MNISVGKKATIVGICRLEELFLLLFIVLDVVRFVAQASLSVLLVFEGRRLLLYLLQFIRLA